jgi:hypothetical protein
MSWIIFSAGYKCSPHPFSAGYPSMLRVNKCSPHPVVPV